MVRVAPGSEMRTKRTGEQRSTAISGTKETPIPALTAKQTGELPTFRKQPGGRRTHDRTQPGVSRKQCPSRRSRKGSLA